MKTTKASLGFLMLTYTFGTVACGGDAENAPTWEGEPPTVEDIRAASAASGTYAVTTTIDVNALVIAPQSAVDVVALMRDMNDKPGTALIAHADRAGVPAVGEIHGALPDVLSDRLDGWMSDAIWRGQPGGHAYRDQMTSFVGLMDATLFRFDVLTELTVPPSEAAGTATHVFRGVTFGGLGGTIPLHVAKLTGAAHITETTPTFRVGLAANGSASLVVGAHAFGLPVGEYAYAALDGLAQQRYGTTFRGSMVRLIDCGRVAHEVASQCVDLPGPLPEVCVGHERALAEVCNRGLDALDELVRAKLREMNIDVLRFQRGTASFHYATETRVDTLESGAWQAQLNLSQGPRDVRTTFVATRH